ncbi:MAG TPA: YkyA family protein, partial [Virgibacillus sp.]|nr:YkyA family protein [Virgibacillus sp.]
MPLKKTLLLLTISLVTFLTACNSGSTEEKIHGHLEEAVTIEADFEKHQNEITDLEKKEQELYSEIIDLSSEEFDEIRQASQEATEIIDERTDKIELEKESIEASQDEFEKTDQLIDKLEDEKAQDKGKEMYDVMMERYKSYENLYEAYTKSLKLEKELYTMLQKEDVEQEDLTN